jgi:hypothetical protein
MSSFSKKRVLEILDQAQEGDNFSKLIDRCLRRSEFRVARLLVHGSWLLIREP